MYGAGAYAQWLLPRLVNYGYKVIAVCVTTPKDKKEEYFNGYPVITSNEAFDMIAKNHDIKIVIGVGKEEYRKEVYDILGHSLPKEIEIIDFETNAIFKIDLLQETLTKRMDFMQNSIMRTWQSLYELPNYILDMSRLNNNVTIYANNVDNYGG